MKTDCGLPEELLSPLYPNIGLAGLDLNNPLHCSIWDAFTTNMHSDNGPGKERTLGQVMLIKSTVDPQFVFAL